MLIVHRELLEREVVDTARTDLLYSVREVEVAGSVLLLERVYRGAGDAKERLRDVRPARPGHVVEDPNRSAGDREKAKDAEHVVGPRRRGPLDEEGIAVLARSLSREVVPGVIAGAKALLQLSVGRVPDL